MTGASLNIDTVPFEVDLAVKDLLITHQCQ